MEYIAVLVAAAGAYAFGAFWYMVNSKAWLAAAGVECDENGRPKNGNSPMPFIISAIAMIVVSGMMRHVFAMSDIVDPDKGALAGFGIGAFIVLPWIVVNYAYSMRPRTLSVIDGAYAVIGCTIIGTILTLF